uniref:Ig-like domain-containing protein n=1 Tax=Scophthalmus maximus TaxID=52904 RepID=A0A8D3C4C1_SCOMX
QSCWSLVSSHFRHETLCKAQDRVVQPAGDVTATEGDTLTLGCTFQTSDSNPYLYWYKQDGNNRPTFILSHFTVGEGKTEDDFRERFSSTLDSTSRSVPLQIQKLQLSDSAVYYCALRPTVTGNNTTLYKNLCTTRGRHYEVGGALLYLSVLFLGCTTGFNHWSSNFLNNCFQIIFKHNDCVSLQTLHLKTDDVIATVQRLLQTWPTDASFHSHEASDGWILLRPTYHRIHCRLHCDLLLNRGGTKQHKCRCDVNVELMKRKDQ